MYLQYKNYLLFWLHCQVKVYYKITFPIRYSLSVFAIYNISSFHISSPYSLVHLLSFKDSISLYGFPVTPNTTPEGFLFYPTRPTFPIHETVVLCLCVNLPHDINTQRLPGHNGQISRPQSSTI